MKMVITKEDMMKFAGEWILLFDDKIVDHSQSLEEILKIAEEYPEDKIVIAKAIPPLPKVTEK